MTAQRPDAGVAIPEASGLFDPKREYDACGVGFIADLKGGKSHQIIKDALYILENLEHRGAVGADPIAGDGAGILIQIPHAFLEEECASPQDQAAEARPLRRRPSVHAAGRAAAGALRARVDAHHPRGGPGVPGLALGAGRQLLPVGDDQGGRAGAPADLHRPAEGDEGQPRVRAPALSHPQGRLQRAPLRLQGPRHRPLHGVAVEPHAGLQGHVPVLPGEGLLQGPVRSARRLGDGAGAPALLHQHLPVVEAGAPLPHGRPQRRDQHAARQRQLDGGAAGVGVVAAVRRATSPSCGPSPTRASRTRRASTTRSSSW